MSFDQSTRNALSRLVAKARELLRADVEDHLRRLGFQGGGAVLDLAAIADLTEAERAASEALRAQLEHFTTAESGAAASRRAAAYDRLVREIGFTTLNRLVAVRMAEERGLIAQSVGGGLASDGFRVYERLANSALGSRAATYRAYLECLYDELALDLPALFDRATPESLVFPGERCVEEVLALLDDPALAHLWREDETIGWVYQYYNDPAERKKMRDASAAPRNSRELAVRNQFFTPRYIVAFLTDNTLGRTWYEMRRGETQLQEQCRYMVRRKHTVFLRENEHPPEPFSPESVWGDPDDNGEMWVRPNPNLQTIHDIWRYALTVGGYDYATKHMRKDCAEIANEHLRKYAETGKWEGSFEELRCCLFFEQRRYHHFGEEPEGESAAGILSLYEAICRQWNVEVEQVSYRAKKDPRDLKILDPACGSGHFLLYAFDLLETIYEEAWAGEDSLASEVTGRFLREDYPNLVSLRRAVPELIIRHNLHGIEIDPRCCQIAGLAIWLRAQRRYKDLGLRPAERPRITKSNIVCAEPMPGERETLEEYLRCVDKRLHPLVRQIWERMQLAGEVGSLLRIDAEIADALADARTEAMVDLPPYQVTLFEKDQAPQQTVMTLASVEDQAFWRQAERSLLDALRDYTIRVSNGETTRRRLFADDAAQGFAFVDLCRKRFDVVLMNPPFGQGVRQTHSYLTRAYPHSSDEELYASFYTRALSLLQIRGRCGVISSRTGFFLYSLGPWRNVDVIQSSTLEYFVELGEGVLDQAMNETAAYVFRNSVDDIVSLFAMLHRADHKDEAILKVWAGPVNRYPLYAKHCKDFRALPDAPFCYWASARFLRDCSHMKPLGEDLASIQMGLAPRDEFRFSRLWWEVPAAMLGPDRKWVPYAKGGELTPYYYDVDLVLNAENDLEEIRADLNRKYPYLRGNLSWVLHPENDYFEPGLTFNQRTVRLKAAVLPRGSYFSVAGKAIFGRRLSNLAILAALNTVTHQYLAALRKECLQMRPQYQEGDVARIPWPTIPDAARERLATIAGAALRICRSFAMLDETDHAYSGLQPFAAYSGWRTSELQAFTAYEKDADDIFASTIELADQDAEFLANEIVPDCVASLGSYWFRPTEHDTWAFIVGCAFGRWDIRITRDPSLAPKLPDPFDPVLRCPPGMLVGPDGLPATSSRIVSEDWLAARPDANTLPGDNVRKLTIADAEYQIPTNWTGILVEDQEDADDIIRRVRDVTDVLWRGRADSVEQLACRDFGVNSLRDYFRKPDYFFAHHLKRYSKSRRRAPIYWPLSTATGSYTLWIYYQRLTSDTLFTAVNRHVEPKIAAAQRELGDFEIELKIAVGLEAARLRERAEDARAFLTGLRDFRAELLRVAALPYQPDLNDGVIINAAPLHKLFRLSKWAKDTKECWQKLERGDYDWAHMALVLWPDRVREKCKSDRSLAIAHNLEELYVAPPATKRRKGAPAPMLDNHAEDEEA